MSRGILLRVLAALALAGLGIFAVAIGRLREPAAPEQIPADDLAAPLAADSEADFAAALPTIDELRHRRGSVLDGSPLESFAGPEPPHDNSYVDLLRREARRLEGVAADKEDVGHFDDADGLRREAQHLREQARELSRP